MLNVAVFILGIAIIALAYPPTWGFLAGIANTWVWDMAPPSDPAISGYGSNVAPYNEATSAVATRVLSEIQTGWSVQTTLDFWGSLFPLAIFLSLILATGIIYCTVRVLQLRRIERAAIAAAARPVVSQDIARTKLRWRRIEEQVNSEDPEKWKLALMEADIMLNDLLDVLGYKGETMIDKMKQVPVEEFNSIDFAWEAHKIRNRIVQEGAEFKLDAREAKRVFRMYERVLEEFKYIE